MQWGVGPPVTTLPARGSPGTARTGRDGPGQPFQRTADTPCPRPRDGVVSGFHPEATAAVEDAVGYEPTCWTRDPGRACRDMDQVLNEIRQLEELIENQGKQNVQAMPAKVNITKAPLLGSVSAPLTLVEFTDYQCPFCQRFFLQTFPELKRTYIDTGIVRFYVMDFPLPAHKNALQAAQAARCASDQGKFWEMHDQMQAHPETLEINELVGYAREFGMNADEFRSCIESGKHRQAVQDEGELAKK